MYCQKCGAELIRSQLYPKETWYDSEFGWHYRGGIYYWVCPFRRWWNIHDKLPRAYMERID